ncbi:hypothetical protein BDP27DRAFT_1309523 [Rhodocollybia butyracea]|uniref:SAP domain-containing protein n=1 Tax=Rhodocollybia butyracea TaxID=206335 RepID=A0A9P5QB05_9AGAR|nr:hypothetical protein BDP27DRAFT_1309523 [Rhodocollybia butyracea]
MASSSQTTEILFNSPALHSLKRDQLVKLCKIHSIKASGKNVELIERLKKVAEDLPKDAPLSIAARSDIQYPDNVEMDEKENAYSDKMNLPRPSEQWQVMESIAEGDSEDSGSRNGTLKSLGSNREFGTNGSKSSTMSLSIKALASSLGLKRSTSAKSIHDTSMTPPLPVLPVPTAATDELSKYATPYTSLPVPSPSQLPQTDHFADFSHFSANPPSAATLSKFDFSNKEDTTPIPGHVLRPGAPAPDNARLSLGNARFSFGFGLGSPRKSTSETTTTIRLVSSSSMTGVADSPQPSISHHGIDNNQSPSTPQLKPWNTAFDLVLGSPTGPSLGENVRVYPNLPLDDSVTISEPPVPGGLSSQHLTSPKVEPFVFGSPLPQHRVSNAQFQSAAASVLEEMNRRLEADGVDTVGTSFISTLRPGAGVDLTPHSKKVYTDRAIKPLRKSYGANSAKKEVKEKFERAHKDHFNEMESIAGYLDRKKTTDNSSLAKRGPLSDPSNDEPVQAGKKRKSSALGDGRPVQAKRPSTRVISNTRRTVPGGFGDDDEEEEAPVGKKARVDFSNREEEDKTAEERSEKEREAIRRKLEINRARRRSSVANGRPSMGRGRTSMGRNNVLHKTSHNPPASKSRFGFLSTAAKSIVKGVWGGGKKSVVTKPVPVASRTAPAPTPTVSNVSSQGTTTLPITQGNVAVSKSSVVPAAATSQVPSTSSRTSHNRNASTTGTMTSLGSVAATIHSARSRSPLPSFAAPTRSSSIRTSTTGTTSTRNSSVASRAGGSSIGINPRTSATSSRVSSLGARSHLSQGPTSSTSSRLLAPTVSSLAKTAGINKLKSVALSPPHVKPSDSPVPPSKIFSKPLVVPLGSGLPSPIRNGHSQTAVADASVQKQRSLSGRKPRISRSKVIAKLASQRTASGSSQASNSENAGSSAVSLAAKRSSLGVGVHKAPRKSIGGARRSHVGVSGTRTSEANVLLSAKKRARQSEYARRRSRATGASVGVTRASNSVEGMDVDI